jgi:hypothetical protein
MKLTSKNKQNAYVVRLALILTQTILEQIYSHLKLGFETVTGTRDVPSKLSPV